MREVVQMELFPQFYSRIDDYYLRRKKKNVANRNKKNFNCCVDSNSYINRRDTAPQNSGACKGD